MKIRLLPKRAGWRFVVMALAIGWVIPNSVLAQEATPAEPECIAIEDKEGCLPVADERVRVDLAKPVFSNPTKITNPLFPISDLQSVVLLGNVDGQLFRTEVTLLDETKIIEIDGQPVEVLVSQYVAFLDGQIEEVALDWYAQADDGSVWYLGEDVFNYVDGVVEDTHGTWMAGRDGPAAMIMPGNPQVGNVYRPENMPEIVFEEVEIVSIDQTVNGPWGSVSGAILTSELHMDGLLESKLFAPGYGEFLTSGNGDIEALALAVPTDALEGDPSADILALYDGAASILAAAEAGDFAGASATLDQMTTSWENVQATGGAPFMIIDEMNRALQALAGDSLIPAVNGGDEIGTRKAAVRVARASLDLILQYQEPDEVDLSRLGLWAQQLRIDAEINDPGAVHGDVTSLEWTWDRIAPNVDPASAESVEGLLGEIRTAADEDDLVTASELTDELISLLASVTIQ